MSLYNGNYYEYNHQGVRYQKRFGSTIINYVLDGSKIILESISTDNGQTWGKHFGYHYDIEGVCGLSYNNKHYNFVRDALGNITKVMRFNMILGEYVYDAWGNCTILNTSNCSGDDLYVLQNNPFRWKSYYYDVETGFYNINGRIYDPVLMQYLDAEIPENLFDNVFTLNALDRNAIVAYNIINLIPSIESIFSAIELSDANYHEISSGPSAAELWWSEHWNKVVAATIFLANLVLMCIPGCQGFAAGMLIAGISGGISGIIIGSLVGGITSVIQGNDFYEGASKNTIDNFLNGFISGAIMYCVSAGINAIVNAANKATPCHSSCFIAGTLILCQDEEGNECHKPIEKIEIGDYVWAYDEETGENDWKPVVRLFRNETIAWYHIFAAGQEIICTPNHPLYVLGKGFVEAKDLKTCEILLQSDGTNAIIEAINVEQLDKLETTYNFEVADFHTYYVTDSSILVHNFCELNNIADEGIDIISDMLYDDMLYSEKVAYDGYSKNGWKGNYAGQAKGLKAGGKYLNSDNKLPLGSYRKFDINVKSFGARNRDAWRFVVDENLNVYLTRDHYETFFRIIKGG